jgi:hypothetical protein
MVLVDSIIRARRSDRLSGLDTANVPPLKATDRLVEVMPLPLLADPAGPVELLDILPLKLVRFIVTLMYLPASSAIRVYVAFVAPQIPVNVPFAELARIHWLMVPLPFRLVVFIVMASPTFTVPLMLTVPEMAVVSGLMM